MQTSPLGDYHHLNTFEIAPLPSFSLPTRSLVTLSRSLILHPDYPASLISWIKVFLRSVRVRTQVNEYARDSHKHWFAFAQVLSKIHYPQIPMTTTSVDEEEFLWDAAFPPSNTFGWRNTLAIQYLYDKNTFELRSKKGEQYLWLYIGFSEPTATLSTELRSE